LFGQFYTFGKINLLFIMKLKFIFTVVALFLVTLSGIYASFPVERSTNSNTTVVENVEEEFSSPATSNSGKSQLTALLLAIFVGGIGIHRFYLGYTWQGVVQLLTLGGCGIWALIDLVRIITGDLEPKSGPYSKTL
jgi:hypothetical protein